MTLFSPVDPTIDVTVCIVNWNGARWLRNCLTSLREVQGVRFEIIVVDNASEDGSAEMVRNDFPEAQMIVNCKNAGFAKANNQALHRGRGRYFIILNNDTVLYKGTLGLLQNFLDGHPEAGMVSGHLVNPDGSTQFRYYPEVLPSPVSLAADLLWLNKLLMRPHWGRGPLARKWNPSQAQRMEQIPGACMFLRREMLENVGLLDESYPFWYEDVDLCARCLRAGWEIWFLPEARITHQGGVSTKMLDRSARSLLRFRGMLRYAEKHFSRDQLLRLRVLVVLILLLRFPIVLGASLWPSRRVREEWKGAWRAYFQLLGEVVSPSAQAG